MARGYIGAPFRHRGRSRDGIDCVGLIFVSVSPFIAIEDVWDYPSDPLSIQSFMKIKNCADRIMAEDAGPGDIIIMNTGGRSTHYGLIAGSTVIHADRSSGRVVEQSLSGIRDRQYGARIVAYYRMKGVAPWVPPAA